MKSKNWALALILVLVTTACSTLKGVGEAISTGLKGTPEVTCSQVAQEGCITLRIMNLQFDGKNPLMIGLDVPPTTQSMKEHRARILPVEAYKAYASGKIVASVETSYHLYMWNVDKTMPTSKMNVWRLNNGDQVTKGVVEDVTATVPAPVLDTPQNLGAPNKVFRVTASGKDAGAVSFQVPWSFFMKDSVVMVTSERTSVYPGPRNGIWLSSAHLNGTLRAGGWKTTNLVFLHGPVKTHQTAKRVNTQKQAPTKPKAKN